MAGELQFATADPAERLLKCSILPNLKLDCKCCPGGAGNGKCTWLVTPPGFLVDKAGGDGTIDIDTYIGCSWYAIKVDKGFGTAWLHIGPLSGLSDGFVHVDVDANTGPQRTADVEIWSHVGVTGWPYPPGKLVGTVTIVQNGDPVPAVCPAGLAASYKVTGGPITKGYLAAGVPGYPAGIYPTRLVTIPAPLQEWDGIVRVSSPCAWVGNLPISFNRWLGRYLTGVPITVSFFPGAFWRLRFPVLLSDTSNPPFILFAAGTWVGDKTFGADPLGPYTEINGCSPLTLTVAP